MITRRTFLSALCAIPFVGKFMPKAETIPLVMEPMDDLWYSAVPSTPLYPTPGFEAFATMPATITDMTMSGNRLFVTCGEKAYEVFEDGTYTEI